MTYRVIPLMQTGGKDAEALAAASVVARSVPDLPPGAVLAAADVRGRMMRDLRISVTDRCNFRCTYCMPKTVFGRDYPFLPRSEILSFDEIVRVARIFSSMGVRKVRLTGGEPLLRRNIEYLIEMLAAIPDLELTLTTNGSLLTRKAQGLRAAGLQRVTVSLDALDDATFRRMNDVDFPVAEVLRGIEAAAAAGLPVKVNMVVRGGANDHAILPMARYFHGSGHILRFIEYMDVGSSNGWKLDEVVPSAEVVRRIDAELPLECAESNYLGEVAERWRYRDGGGEIGVISSVTQAFCATCTRVRLSTDGSLYTCLFAQQGHDLRAMLRNGSSDEEIIASLAAMWRVRNDNYSERRNANTPGLQKIEMSYIGG
ncbi:Cyclic pyranopterin monophosphate synthase [Sterolibacterium denitrificans]|uniref:GTP 3',8-cyclase n=2 Tax=Sterolibacterium denitrificans TaxID=157592 RepID=A0A7Z7MV50_9PROT|nr:GTP 3',8-cyclase MoaA [Sterolibacterium denitrificans]SMB25847.1 Cyclic pyranopterin monophosphate synthase [Sterolibacterium denitrificans]